MFYNLYVHMHAYGEEMLPLAHPPFVWRQGLLLAWSSQARLGGWVVCCKDSPAHLARVAWMQGWPVCWTRVAQVPALEAQDSLSHPSALDTVILKKILYND